MRAQVFLYATGNSQRHLSGMIFLRCLLGRRNLRLCNFRLLNACKIRRACLSCSRTLCVGILCRRYQRAAVFKKFRSGNNRICPAGYATGYICGRYSTVDFYAEGKLQFAAKFREPFYFFKCVLIERLSAETGLDAHYQN